ncbi:MULTISPECIES: hypothetical protein [unclassified Shewanella]|uniref:hypothetical protein n=1 Tax=unclassified Shewanella TaxID=196818 RepID=UPI001BBC25F2|nr:MULTISPECIES: hypothetical protein [unclassified Shewanella]GIU12861.1 hypothetical protein TUM4444_20760 [Shewanella sp. MBTL60-112-B1]GIU38223.1 hypothetical protein TUM4445_31970 [Shewanella sp. MBTL60-112-B2]
MTKNKINIEWTNQREAQWENDILPRLVSIFIERFTKKQLADFKRYYITGRAPKWNRDDNVNPVPLIVRLWLAPDSSLDNWLSIRDVIFDGKEDMQDLEYEIKYIEYLFQEANSNLYNEDYNISNGFFLGMEKSIVDFYFEYLGDERYFRAPKIEVDKYVLLGLPREFGGMHGWLCTDKVINKNKLSQHCIKYWIKSLSWADEKSFGSGGLPSKKYHLLKLFYSTVNFTISGTNDVREAFVCELIDVLNNEELPGFINHWWLLAQKAASLEDLLLTADPFFSPIPEPEPVIEKSLKQKLLEKRSATKKKRRGKLV